MLELDVILAGPDGQIDEAEMARRNAAAQQRLLMTAPGALVAPPKRKPKKRTVDGDS